MRTTLGSIPDAPPPPAAFAARMQQIVQGLKALRESGGRLVVATDAGVAPAKPHDSLAYTVIHFGGATEDPVDALRAATSRAADALGLTDTCGRLAPGRAGDLLVIRGEAVADLSALLEVEAVYREGQQVAGPSSRPQAHG